MNKPVIEKQASFLDDIQKNSFDQLEVDIKENFPTHILNKEHFNFPIPVRNRLQLHNRRYIGSKQKLISWIFSIISQECSGKTFADVFAGTGIVAAAASTSFKKIILNDLLYSNNIIYKAFFSSGDYRESFLQKQLSHYNSINPDKLDDNYFSANFGGKYFSTEVAKSIGHIRDNIESDKENLLPREYAMLLTSLIYAADKTANTVGHYDAYFKKDDVKSNLFMLMPHPISAPEVEIYRQDANVLTANISSDILYIDPPYNSRQYSRFYHLLETLTKWDKSKLYGVALKPLPENMSDYCRVSAGKKLNDLINSANAKYIVVSYNNTYASKSSSSQNKISLDTIHRILNDKGKTKVFEKPYRHFNAGNTDFADHKEYLFVTAVK